MAIAEERINAIIFALLLIFYIPGAVSKKAGQTVDFPYFVD